MSIPVEGDPDISRWRYFPGQSPLILHGVNIPLPSPLFPINNIKRSTVNVYKTDSCRSVRVRSVHTFSVSFQMFALTARGGVNVLSGMVGNCPG